MDSHAISSYIHLGPAYLDGGTGSMMLQAAIAGVLSAGFILKTRWIQLKSILVAKKKNSSLSH